MEMGDPDPLANELMKMFERTRSKRSPGRSVGRLTSLALTTLVVAAMGCDQAPTDPETADASSVADRDASTSSSAMMNSNAPFPVFHQGFEHDTEAWVDESEFTSAPASLDLDLLSTGWPASGFVQELDIYPDPAETDDGVMFIYANRLCVFGSEADGALTVDFQLVDDGLALPIDQHERRPGR